MEEPKKQKLGGGIVSFLKTLSVEPAALLMLTSLVMRSLIFQHLLMDTVCRVDLNLEEDVCHQIANKVNDTFKSQEREIQKEMAAIRGTVSQMESTLTVLTVLFVGPWSDIYGRKIPLLVSSTGVALSVMMTVSPLYLGHLGGLRLGLLIQLPMSLTGGVSVFSESSYCYLCDTTKKSKRSLRLGLLAAMARIGLTLGLLVGAKMLQFAVPTVLYCIITSCFGISAPLLVFFLVENKVPEKSKSKHVREDQNNTWCKTYNPLALIYQVLRFLVQMRHNKGRPFLLLLAYVLYVGPLSAENRMIYLFVRERLHWNIPTFGFFHMFNFLMSAVGILLAMFVLIKKLKMKDASVALVAGISHMAGSIVLAFAFSSAMMYIGSTVDMLGGTMDVITRSMLSKMVSEGQVGKLYSVIGAMETSMPFLSVPLYAFVYSKTVDSFAGTIFLISAVSTVPAIFIFLYYIRRKEPINTNAQEGYAVHQKGSIDSNCNYDPTAGYIQDGMKRTGGNNDQNANVEEMKQLNH